MITYYTLMPSKLARVDELAPEPDEDELPAFTTPRSIAIGDTVQLWDERDDIEYLISGRIALVKVSPRGEVVSAHIDGGGSEVVASQGWMVEAILSLDQLLGPDAAAIRQIASTPMGINQESDYAGALSQEGDLDQIVKVAKNALVRADIDGDWWESQVGCTHGYELPALAASDLVDVASDWNPDAFDQLTRPWTRVMGWPAVQPCP